jgi:hypothetical protein
MYALASAKHLGSVSSGAMLIHTTINGIKNQWAILAIPTTKLNEYQLVDSPTDQA